MIFERLWAFDVDAPKTITAQAISSNVRDAGSARIEFAGTARVPFRIAGWYLPNSGTNVTMRVQFVGADDAGLTSNVLVLADTGVSPVLTNGVPVPYEMIPQLQQTAKRFYGLIYIPGGTTPNVDVVGGGTFVAQSAMPARKAAVP